MSRLLAERRLELVIVLVVVVLDQVTKALVRDALALHESLEVIPGLLDLTRVHNTGAAFGMLNGVDFAFKTVVMSMIALAALGGIGYALSVPLGDGWRGPASPGSSAARSATSSTGPPPATSSISWTYRAAGFWAFNVADAAITVGVGCMILDILGLGRRASDSL